MNRLLNIELRADRINIVLLILRVGIAGMMLVHGFPKLEMLLGGEAIQFPGIMGMSPELSLSLAVFAEVLCSFLILLGFGTRLASIPLIITMLTAVFLVHGADPFSNQELGLHYLLAYVVLLILGSGKYSLDALISAQKEPRLKSA